MDLRLLLPTAWLTPGACGVGLLLPCCLVRGVACLCPRAAGCVRRLRQRHSKPSGVAPVAHFLQRGLERPPGAGPLFPPFWNQGYDGVPPLEPRDEHLKIGGRRAGGGWCAPSEVCRRRLGLPASGSRIPPVIHERPGGEGLELTMDSTLLVLSICFVTPASMLVDALAEECHFLSDPLPPPAPARLFLLSSERMASRIMSRVSTPSGSPLRY